MATLPGKYWSNDAYRPRLSYTVTASQTGRTSTTVTHKIKVQLALESSGSYGYEIRIHGAINGVAVDKLLKSTTGSLSSSVEFSITSNKNASGGTIPAKLYSFSPNDSTHWQNSFNTGDKNLDVSSFNTAPTMSGSVSLRENNSSGAVIGSNGYIPENLTKIYVSWPKGSDDGGESNLRYGVNRKLNGVTTTVCYPTNSKSYTDTISANQSGTQYEYYLNARDQHNVLSNNIYSNKFTVNTMTGDTLSSSSSIAYGSTSLSFTYSGAKNTNGNTTFTRSLSADGITVYNPNLGASPATITIYKSGTVPTGCYVKFDDIKAKFASSSYRGTLAFTLTTTNAYGTRKASAVSVPVNLQTAPNASGAPTVATDANSTSYVTSVGSTKYYIPANGRKTRINWTAGSGKLGEAVSYEVYVSYNGGSWQSIGTTTNNYFDHTFSQTVSAKQSVKYLVRTRVSYGLYADATQATAVDYHYWNPPTIGVATPVRAATTATTTIALKLNTSIPSGVSPSGTWQSFVSGSATVHQSGTLTSSTANQNISMSGLAENSGYTLKITYKDNTAFSANIIQEVSIPANQPVFFVNQYGVGVGGEKATASDSLRVKGGAKFNKVDFNCEILGPGVDLNNLKTAGEYVQNANANTSLALNYPEALAGHLTVSYGAGPQQRYHIYNTSRIYTRAQYGTGDWTPWAKDYNTLNKPTPNEINAIGQKSLNGYQGMSVNNNDDQTWVRTTKNGLIPYQSGGDSSLGISGWPFSNVYANNIYMGGSKVVERGGNGNGEYTKFADGTLICVKVLNVATTITSTWGNIYTSGLPISMGPPAHSFVAADYKMSITLGSYNSGGEQYTAGILISKGQGYRPPGTSDFGQAIELFRGTSIPSKNYIIQIIAIGRWK